MRMHCLLESLFFLFWDHRTKIARIFFKLKLISSIINRDAAVPWRSSTNQYFVALRTP